MHPGRIEAEEDWRRKAESGGHRKKGGGRDRKCERKRDGSEAKTYDIQRERVMKKITKGRMERAEREETKSGEDGAEK